MLNSFNNFNIWVYTILNTYIKGSYIKGSNLNLVTTSNNLYKLLYILKSKTQLQLIQLVDIFILDNIEVKNRFRITYSLLSIIYNSRVNISFSSSQMNSINSIISLYSSAN
jgi:NADH:ubiquinone oxidoreductase subunit C